MLNENITFTASELNEAVNKVRTISSNVLPPKNVKVVNATEGILSFSLFTDSEYAAYLALSSITDFFIVYPGEQRVLNDLDKFTTTLVVIGTEEHTAPVTFEVIK